MLKNKSLPSQKHKNFKTLAGRSTPSSAFTASQKFYLGLNMAWRQILWQNRRLPSAPSFSLTSLANFSSKSQPYILKVGIPEFLKGVGKGVESHVEKLETEIGDLQKLLVTRTLRLKKLGVPCKHRKLILKYAHKYRLGLWRPRADMIKA